MTNMYYLQQIIEDPNLVKDGIPYEVNRTWRERLFSTPWKPWRKKKTVIPKIPDMHIYTYNNYMVMRPEVARVLIDLKNMT